MHASFYDSYFATWVIKEETKQKQIFKTNKQTNKQKQQQQQQKKKKKKSII